MDTRRRRIYFLHNTIQLNFYTDTFSCCLPAPSKGLVEGGGGRGVSREGGLTNERPLTDNVI